MPPSTTRKSRAGSWRSLSAREKIDRTAYDLFSRHGIRAVGVDSIVAKSGVAKMTLYRHYESKDALALAFLDRRWELFSRGWQAAVEQMNLPPRDVVLGLFDVLDKWLQAPDYAGCPVVKAVLETEDRTDTVRQAAVRYFAGVRTFLRTLAVTSEARDPDQFAAQLHMLIWGSIIAASAGDRQAAATAKAAAQALLEAEVRSGRPPRRRKAK